MRTNIQLLQEAADTLRCNCDCDECGPCQLRIEIDARLDAHIDETCGPRDVDTAIRRAEIAANDRALALWAAKR